MEKSVDFLHYLIVVFGLMPDYLWLEWELKIIEVYNNGILLKKTSIRGQKISSSICFKSGQKKTDFISMKWYTMERDNK